MGIAYCGAYADQIGDHEGFAGRRQLDGTVTSAWTTEFTAYVAACDCGWQGDVEHPPTDAGADAASDDWRHAHLHTLIDKASDDWINWPERVADLAQAIASYVLDSRPDLAARVADCLQEDIAAHRRIAERLDQDGV